MSSVQVVRIATATGDAISVDRQLALLRMFDLRTSVSALLRSSEERLVRKDYLIMDPIAKSYAESVLLANFYNNGKHFNQTQFSTFDGTVPPVQVLELMELGMNIGMFHQYRISASRACSECMLTGIRSQNRAAVRLARWKKGKENLLTLMEIHDWTLRFLTETGEPESHQGQNERFMILGACEAFMQEQKMST